jgi:hypothetical protein
MDPEMLDMMAMEEMMGGGMGGGMDPMMGGGDMNEMVQVMVPAWTVPAVEELVAILSQGDAGGDPMMGSTATPMMPTPRICSSVRGERRR